MKKNKIMVGILSLLILIVIASNVSALGISPGSKNIDFQPNLEEESKIKIFNNEKRNLSLSVHVRGPINNSVEFEKKEFFMGSETDSISIPYKLALPEALNPGKNIAEIVILETPLVQESGSLAISAKIALTSQIVVNVPYPGKFLEVDMNIVTKESVANFFVRVKNLGSEKIEDTRAIITIWDHKKDIVDVLHTNALTLEPQKREEFKASWTGKFGEYTAIADINYDGLKTSIETSFTLGDFFLKPLRIYSGNFELGEIVKINLDVENLANREIKDAKANIVLRNNVSDKIINIPSDPKSIVPLSVDALELFWDSKETEEGIYSGTLELSYEDKVKEYKIRTIVEKKDIFFQIEGITMVLKEKTKEKNLRKTILIISLLLIFIWTFINFKQKRNLNIKPKIKR